MFKSAVELASSISENLPNQLEQIKSNIESIHYEKLSEICHSAKELLDNIQELQHEFDLYQLPLKPEAVGLPELVKQGDAKTIGSGHFGIVYPSKFKGVDVAIKLIKSSKNSQEQLDFENEIKKLRSLRHDNIVGYRGSGIYNGRLFIVMEYIKENLMDFVKSHSSHDGSGLSAFLTWHISKQVANGMDFLHSLEITHRDLKPDNILLDTSPVHPKVKLCDFGLSERMEREYVEPQDGTTSNSTRQGHVRYQPPEIPRNCDDWKKVDVFCFGLVVLVTRTGKRPWDEQSTNKLAGQLHSVDFKKSIQHWYIGDIKVSDNVLEGNIGDIVQSCCADAAGRPSFNYIIHNFFSKENPYMLKGGFSKGEFFSCGFLTNTNIFVADSVFPENDLGSSVTSSKPTYRLEDLKCEVELNTRNEDYIPIDEVLQDKYYANYATYKDKARRQEIDDNPMLALKKLTTDRAGDDESQKITLRFIQSTYCHHRAMRDIWRGFDEVQKTSVVPCKGEVNELYSTSFGLHVAILTNEGDGKKKFVFTERSKKEGMAAPGAYTCGAVESCSILDYVKSEGETATVSLIETAARGLKEELGLQLNEEGKEAIHLTTTYLKFDNHEWGMCGFVDLTDKRVSEELRFSFDQLNFTFTSGSGKDKFEHSCIHGVDFHLDTMVAWIREHHGRMASSAKIAAVKVLQAYFPTSLVIKEFEKFAEAEK